LTEAVNVVYKWLLCRLLAVVGYTALAAQARSEMVFCSLIPITLLSAMEWNTLAANNVTQQQMEPFHCCQDDFGGLRAVYVW